MTARTLTTDAVVLRRVLYGDADLIVTLYTRDRGRVSALARSARRSRKRFGPAIDLFGLSRVQLGERPRSELWTLREADLVRGFAAIAADVAALAHASYGTELVRELTVAEEPDSAILDLLIELYALLCAHPPTAGALRAFELRLLGVIGLAPVLDRCAGCGDRDLDVRGLVLDPERGGVVCPRCAAQSRGVGVRPLPSEALRVLWDAQRATSLTAAAAADAPGPAARQARDALLPILLGHVGKPLRSLEFLAKLQGARSKLGKTQ